MSDNTKLVDTSNLDNKNIELAQSIIDEEDVSKVKDMINLFNLTQTKKNVIRAMKLSGLYDSVSDKLIERLQKRPDEISYKELVDIFNATQKAIDSANKSLGLIEEMPTIQLNQQNINISVDNDDELSRDSKIKVMEAVKAFLDSQKNENTLEIVEEDSETSSD